MLKLDVTQSQVVYDFFVSNLDFSQSIRGPGSGSGSSSSSSLASNRVLTMTASEFSGSNSNNNVGAGAGACEEYGGDGNMKRGVGRKRKVV